MDKQLEFDTLYDCIAFERTATLNLVGVGLVRSIVLGKEGAANPCHIILHDDTWYLISGYTDLSNVVLDQATVDSSSTMNLLQAIASWNDY